MKNTIKKSPLASLENDYFILFRMMISALNNEDVTLGMTKSLYLLKAFLNCGDIVLHRKTSENIYESLVSQARMKTKTSPISSIVNQTAKLTENKNYLHLDIDLSEDIKTITLIHIKTNEMDYILSINNYDISNKNTKFFIQELTEALQVILKRHELHEKHMKAINMDILTGLDNRNSYEKRIEHIQEELGVLTYGLFDLFRLKYINDNYSHAIGDKYIQETAKILQKYWPKYNSNTELPNEKRAETGHCIYRIGGDEFALITTENIKLTKLKALLASEEVEMIDLGENINIPLGLNHGIILLDTKDSIRKGYEDADKIMSEDKRKMYTKFNLERRK